MTVWQLLNQHSFLLLAGGMLAVGLMVLLVARRRIGRRARWIGLLALVALAGAFAVMRTAAPSAYASAADVQRAVSSGRPTLVEFYSDY